MIKFALIKQKQVMKTVYKPGNFSAIILRDDVSEWLINNNIKYELKEEYGDFNSEYYWVEYNLIIENDTDAVLLKMTYEC